MIHLATSPATIYSFTPSDGPGHARCIIEDEARKLTIVSTWGQWSYCWVQHALGAPTFTAFLSQADMPRVADRLQGGGARAGREFSAKKTVAAWRRKLCVRRRESGHWKLRVPLTRKRAREIWEALNTLLAHDNELMFIAQAWGADGVTDWITARPYENLETEQTPEDWVLRELILPALRATLHEQEIAKLRILPMGAQS